jgi:hypothetical protein
MVNGSDYNVLPLVFGNQIAKMQAINRTFSGQSRYIDLNDPTGFHRDLIIFGDDGALYRDNQDVLVQVVEDASNSATIADTVLSNIQELLRDRKVLNFFQDEYLSQFEDKVRVNPDAPGDGDRVNGRSLLDLVPTSTDPAGGALFWRTSPAKFKNDTGYFTNIPSSSVAIPLVNTISPTNVTGNTYNAFGLIQTGSVLEFAPVTDLDNRNTVGVNNVVQNGIQLGDNSFSSVGPVELSLEEFSAKQAVRVYPLFRTELSAVELQEIRGRLATGVSFWIYYDLLRDEWKTSTDSVIGFETQVSQKFEYPAPLSGQIYSNWSSNSNGGLMYVQILSTGTGAVYNLTARGRAFVFESYRDVRFYWDPNTVVIDSASGQALQDSIEIMPLVNTNQSIDNNVPDITDPTESFLKKAITFNITGTFVQDDGYVDSSKVEVSLTDINSDGSFDNPSSFNDIVSRSDRIVFEQFFDEVAGYQTTRPWISKWSNLLQDTTTDLFVYFPVDTSSNPLPDTIYGAPFVSNVLIIDPLNPSTTPGAQVVYMDQTDLFLLNNLAQLAFVDNIITPPQTIANQVTAFLNDDAASYPWITNISGISAADRAEIVNNYFIKPTFLIAGTAPGYGEYYALEINQTDEPGFEEGVVESYTDTRYFDRNGKSFTQNATISKEDNLPLYFKWSHYSPVDQRIDPAPMNIIDMIVITESYYRDAIIWKNSNGQAGNFPPAPTTEELRIQFQELDQYKMLSDSMIWNSGKFKLLFGSQAEPELQATFKVVKSPSTNVSDNEIKTRVIQAVDTYFDIRNWDFGERFFYTELAAFIHQQLSRIISSVVIVPNNARSTFGDLFEIVSRPDELFLSTATVNNVKIVSNLTEQNLRA